MKNKDKINRRFRIASMKYNIKVYDGGPKKSDNIYTNGNKMYAVFIAGDLWGLRKLNTSDWYEDIFFDTFISGKVKEKDIKYKHLRTHIPIWLKELILQEIIDKMENQL